MATSRRSKGTTAASSRILKDVLPKDGFTYRGNTKDVLHRESHDAEISSALRAATPRFIKRFVTPILIDMFKEATALAYAGEAARAANSRAFLDLLRARLTWAAPVRRGVFDAFFNKLVEARLAWCLEPVNPNQSGDHSPLCTHIDDFRGATGSAWFEMDGDQVYIPDTDSEYDAGEESEGDEEGDAVLPVGVALPVRVRREENKDEDEDYKADEEEERAVDKDGDVEMGDA